MLPQLTKWLITGVYPNTSRFQAPQIRVASSAVELKPLLGDNWRTSTSIISQFTPQTQMSSSQTVKLPEANAH